jgi:hypothetical protein
MHPLAEGYLLAVLAACAILILYAWAKNHERRGQDTRNTDRDPGL